MMCVWAKLRFSEFDAASPLSFSRHIAVKSFHSICTTLGSIHTGTAYVCETKYMTAVRSWHRPKTTRETRKSRNVDPCRTDDTIRLVLEAMALWLP